MPLLEKEVGRCEQCGVPLESGTTAFGCLNCLLLGGFSESETESRRFQHYELCLCDDGVTPRELGRGAMGITYRALDINLGSPVALKVISARYSGNPEARERFRREARAAAQLRHANVASVFHFGETPAAQCFYAMELIDGETLEARVRRDGPLPAPLVLDVAIQVARALMAAEAHGLVHRDLKPSNLMIVADNSGGVDAFIIKVIDFGLAKAVATTPNHSHMTRAGFSGTPEFASPEQFTAGKMSPDARSDIYSLGATLWYLLCGNTPFAGRSPARLPYQPLPLEQLAAAKVPAPMFGVLRSMLATNPAQRPQSARELLAVLRRCREAMKAAPRRRKRLTLAVLALGLLAIIVVGLTNYFSRRQPPTIPEKSIAVLPFENLSTDPDNAFFAEGIQEEILARLAKIAELKVISRTSTQQYQSKPGNLSEIAKQLGVANILEGSVQKAGDQVRVNVQLINAHTDSHLWADTFDRKVTDIFSVESEIAKGIARSLQAKLTGREEQALAVKPTSDPEAYDAYLRGLAFDARSSWYNDNTGEKAIASYEKAVQLDPTFALAWARLSYSTAFSYFGRGSTTATPAAAKRALENAQKLQPDSPETLLALAYYQYWVLRDYALAKTTFGLVSKMSPGSEVPSGLAFIARRQGQWDESITYFEQALVLDPRNTELLVNVAFTYCMLRQFSSALKLYDRALDIFPGDPALLAANASVYQAQGDLVEAAKWLPEVNVQTSSNLVFGVKNVQLALERNLGQAVRLVQARQAQFHFESEFEQAGNQVTLALSQRLVGDSAGEKVNAEQACNTLELLCKNQPDNFVYAKVLSQAYAALGNKDAALKEARRAITLLPSAKDAMSGPSFEENLAIIEMIIGENGRAISILAQLLAKPYQGEYYLTPITPALLRLDPIWDTLRADPAFQKLCEEKPH
jgi:serine/threonine protein kinase/Flp pilus assembly protein TadD